MNGHTLDSYLAYALFLTLVGSLFTMAVPLRPSFASHSDIDFEIDGIVFEADDDVTITGTVDGGDDTDEIEITIHEAGSGSESNDVPLDDDGDFDYQYSFPSSPDDGVYQVEFVFGNEDPVFGFFILDDQNDEIDLTIEDEYQLGDDVNIEGNVDDGIFDSDIDEVEITMIGPDGTDELTSEDVPVENNGDFEYDEFSVDNDDEAHGWYAIIVEYDGNEQGWAVFEVPEDDGGSGSDDPITIEFDKTSYRPGDDVVVTGEIADPDVVEAFITVDDPDGDEIFDDSADPTSAGDYEFEFTLDDDAPVGTYTVTVEYNGDEVDDTFTVTSSTSGGSGGSGGSSGSDGGLTARLSKSSLLAGETLTVSGVVPSIAGDEDGVSITVSTPGNNFISAKFPEPESDESYSASFLLPQSLEEDDDYRVVVSYDGNEVNLSFDITGKTTGSTGGPITVTTDKTSYSSGSTVRISGEIADELAVAGEQIALQVFNPDRVPYRFDPIVPEDDGTYSYSMTIGGPLGVTGEWDVKVTYRGQVAETTFDLTGGVASTPRYDLVFEDRTFTIEYESDGTINSMYVRPAEKKLVVVINDADDGKLTITLPREVIDAVQGGSDIKYIVTTLDTQTGTETPIDITESITNAEERTIVIDYEGGTDLIEIQGTNVVPEFGAISAIVLAVAIFSIVAVTAKFSNKFSAFRQW